MDKTENRDIIDWLKPENRFRATALDLLKQGLRTQNWEAIRAAYVMITGESIEHASPKTVEVEKPKGKRGRPRKVVSTPLPQLEPEAEAVPAVDPAFADCVAPAKAKGSKEKIFTRARQHDCKPHPNKFKDDKTEAPDEIIEDRKVPATILNAQRPPTRNVKVKCNGCGKIDEVDPSLLPFGLRLTGKYTMRYLCNNCIVGARSGIEAESDEQSLFEPEEELAE